MNKGCANVFLQNSRSFVRDSASVLCRHWYLRSDVLLAAWTHRLQFWHLWSPSKVLRVSIDFSLFRQTFLDCILCLFLYRFCSGEEVSTTNRQSNARCLGFVVRQDSRRYVKYIKIMSGLCKINCPWLTVCIKTHGQAQYADHADSVSIAEGQGHDHESLTNFCKG